jgi:Holliday junction resolvasome RuvABC endonuclease subunit
MPIEGDDSQRAERHSEPGTNTQQLARRLQCCARGVKTSITASEQKVVPIRQLILQKEQHHAHSHAMAACGCVTLYIQRNTL